MAITGASGAPYARALLRALLRTNLQIHLLVSQSAVIVMREEMDLVFDDDKFNVVKYLGEPITPGRIVTYDVRDLAAPPSSGSFRHRGMVVCPCSMKTLAVIANGVGDSLVSRVADTCLKERRKLVLVPRETPLNLIHLRNMATVTEAGAVVLPAMPGFYARPKTIDDLIDHLVLKIMDSLDIELESDLRWKDGR